MGIRKVGGHVLDPEELKVLIDNSSRRQGRVCLAQGTAFAKVHSKRDRELGSVIPVVPVEHEAGGEGVKKICSLKSLSSKYLSLSNVSGGGDIAEGTVQIYLSSWS
jgi:hypothetical protein